MKSAVCVGCCIAYVELQVWKCLRWLSAAAKNWQGHQEGKVIAGENWDHQLEFG